MTKVLYTIITLLFATCVYLYLEQRDTLDYVKQLMHTSEVKGATINAMNENLVQLTQQNEQLIKRLNEVEDQYAKLKRNPVVITKTITKKNEKVVPISDHASKYYNSILAKRYQNK